MAYLKTRYHCSKLICPATSYRIQYLISIEPKRLLRGREKTIEVRCRFDQGIDCGIVKLWRKRSIRVAEST